MGNIFMRMNLDGSLQLKEEAHSQILSDIFEYEIVHIGLNCR